jgi:hypothetical protein
MFAIEQIDNIPVEACDQDNSILRGDETWLPEWSGNLGGVQRWRRSVAWGVLGQASWLKVWRGGGCNFSATERAHKRNGGQLDGKASSFGFRVKTPAQKKSNIWQKRLSHFVSKPLACFLQT